MKRTAEAEADIAAARAAPTGIELAMQEVDRAEEAAMAEFRNPPMRYRSGDGSSEFVRGSIRAARLPGGNFTLDTTHTLGGLLRFTQLGGRPHIEIERADIVDAIEALQATAGLVPPGQITPVMPPNAIVLTGPEADRYRAVQATSAAALAAQQEHAKAGQALREAIQTMCAGIAPGKEP